MAKSELKVTFLGNNQEECLGIHTPHIKERIHQVNTLLKVIGDHGRNFFRSMGEEPYEYSSFELDEANGGSELFYFDVRSSGVIRNTWDDLTKWRGARFSHGGNLKDFIRMVSGYILTGVPLRHLNYVEYWGYREETQHVEDRMLELGITKNIRRHWFNPQEMSLIDVPKYIEQLGLDPKFCVVAQLKGKKKPPLWLSEDYFRCHDC